MRVYKFLIAFCIFWFILLCLLHYFSLRPLWLDENFILENIESLNFSEILGPLKNAQAFPRIYLVVIKYFSQKFNYNTLSLRFLALISMLSAFFIWARIYKRELPCKWHSLLALFSFTSSYYLSYYASELKHYSIDVLVVGIFCLYFSYQKQYIDKQLSKFFIIATLLLPFTILFAYSSFFVFWIVIYNFLFIVKKNSKILPLLIIYSLMCLLFIIFVFSFDLKYTLSTQALFLYWKDYFLCTDSLYCFLKSFGEGVRKLSVWWFGDNTFFRRVASFFIPFFIITLFGCGFKFFMVWNFKNKFQPLKIAQKLSRSDFLAPLCFLRKQSKGDGENRKKVIAKGDFLVKNRFRLWDIDTLALIVFLELFILGIIKKYPFTGERITLFFAPFAFYLIVKGINSIKMNKHLYLGLNVFYIAFLVVCSLNSFLTYLRLYD